MKKLFVYGIAMLILLASVATVSATEVTVDCGENSWWNPFGNYCQANELQGEFNQVTDMIDHTNKVNNRQNRNIHALENTIDENSDSWSIDTRGTTLSKVKTFLFGDFMNILDQKFVTREEYDSLNYEFLKVQKELSYINQGYTGLYEKGGSLFGYKDGKLYRLV